jgi:hypothetical protein
VLGRIDSADAWAMRYQAGLIAAALSWARIGQASIPASLGRLMPTVLSARLHVAHQISESVRLHGPLAASASRSLGDWLSGAFSVGGVVVVLSSAPDVHSGNPFVG